MRRLMQGCEKILTPLVVSLGLVGLLTGCGHKTVAGQIIDCHPENPYIRDVRNDPTDPTRVTVDADYYNRLLTDLDILTKAASP